MLPRPAAVAAWVLALAVESAGAFAAPLSLEQAFARVAAIHPELRLIDSRRQILLAEQEQASLGPARVLGATLENVVGTDDARSLDTAELTLSLASVIERGGKRSARHALSEQRIAGLATETEARRLDLLAEVARRYLAIVAAERLSAIARGDRADRERVLAHTLSRHEAGASPRSEWLAAEASVARARMELRRAEASTDAARIQLAAMWSERSASFAIDGDGLLNLPPVPDLAVLAHLIDRAPAIARLASEERIREARLQLARSESDADLGWQFGVRRLEATDDFALVVGVSAPLGAEHRAQAGIRAARAELDSLAIAREAETASLYATLAEAHGRLTSASLEMEGIGADVLPRLEQAAAAAEQAWHAGAASYLDWSQLQAEATAARRQQLQAALEARRALIEIQRLTGSAFVTESFHSTTEGEAR